jgi:hypothetical protein
LRRGPPPRRPVMRASDPVVFSNQKYGPGMPKYIYRAQKSDFRTMGFSGTTLLAIMPAFAIFYILLILPFLPDDGKGRTENILFWPVAVDCLPCVRGRKRDMGL